MAKENNEYKVTWTGKKSDPEPQRYYDWMLWKMRQVDEEKLMSDKYKVTVTKTVHIEEFPTDVLVGELYNRIYDIGILHDADLFLAEYANNTGASKPGISLL